MKYHHTYALAIFLYFITSSSSVWSFSGTAGQQTDLPAPGYGELDFKAPEAGSYKLPVLGYAKKAMAIDTDGNPVEFQKMFKGKYTLLNFMYTRCDDLNGCPLSHVVFSRIKDKAKNESAISKNLQMISMSFDPEHDTPEELKKLEQGTHAEHMNHEITKSGDAGDHHGHEMHHMSSHTMENEVTWKYLTSPSYEELTPVLEAYNQSVMPRKDDKGQDTGNFSHILRVYLIDPELRIRNIYSVSFLHPDIIISDLKTLLLEYGDFHGNHDAKNVKDIRVGPGDAKEGYENKDYVTNSLSLQSRKGIETNLLRFIEEPPLGLPSIPIPNDNPITEEKVKLGKKLFFDRRLSLNNTLSCAMCHIPEQGFTSHEVLRSIGFEGRSVRRNAPTIYNTAYFKKLFHDGRETSLELQVWQPLLAHNEMANPAFSSVIEKIKQLDDYKGLFEVAFDGKEADIETIPKALASYERTLISANSPFDKWYFGKEKAVLSNAAIRGFKLFSGKAQCVACHTIAPDHALFTDNSLHNTGIGWERSMKKVSDSTRVQVAPGRYLNVREELIKSVGNQPQGDLGLYEITQDPDDRWKYRTPSLRNVAYTAPYMHDGSLATLEDVIAFYNQGGIKNETQSPLIKPLNLSEGEMTDLVEFLNSLSGDNIQEIISDSFSAPIGDYSRD